MVSAASRRVGVRALSSLLGLSVQRARLCIFVHVFLPRGGLGSLPDTSNMVKTRGRPVAANRLLETIEAERNRRIHEKKLREIKTRKSGAQIDNSEPIATVSYTHLTLPTIYSV